MKNLLFLFGCTAFLAATTNRVAGETQVSLSPGTSGSWNVDWNGATERTDFLQWSTDLTVWHWAPLVEYGAGAKSYGFTSSTDKYFLRLQHDYTPSNDPEGDDYDYDSLSNIDEVTLHDTDPLNWDTDGDGMDDNWEIDNNFDPRDNGSANPDTGPDGDPDGDGLSNLWEFWRGCNPHNAHSDNDGINDGDEVFVYQTNPIEGDSDYDGLNDYDELNVHGTNPNNWDCDNDTLSDGEEINIYGTSPLEMDSDGDWMWDDWEIDHLLDATDAADGLLDADSDGVPNQLEFVFRNEGFDAFTSDSATFPWDGDPDDDGITTTVEFNTYLTNPKQPDTDGDTMDDGWEILAGFNAKLHNSKDNNPNNDETADPDGDHLTNGGESGYGTKPNDPDSDGDGVNDDIEINQGTNPNDPNDHDPPPNGTVAVNVTFGDNSGSHSEKYSVHLVPVEGDTGGDRKRTNRAYGQAQTDTFQLPKGSKYTITLKHTGTDPKYRDEPNPDYDYVLEFPQLAPTAGTIRIVKDPNGIMGEHGESETFFAEGKSADLFVMNFKTETVSPVPQNTDRKKIGVKEEVQVDVTPITAGALSWSLVNQKDATISDLTGYFNNIIGDTRANSTTLRATFDTGDYHDIVWTVVEPNGETGQKTSSLTFQSGTQGAGMILQVTTLPTDVSFYNVEMLEVDKGTVNISGYYLAHTPPNHTPNPNWITLTNDNNWSDTASFFGAPKPWTTGAYDWNIEVRWRTTGEAGQGEVLGNRVQHHTILDATGMSTITKLGQSETRLPGIP